MTGTPTQPDPVTTPASVLDRFFVLLGFVAIVLAGVGIVTLWNHGHLVTCG